MAGVYDVQISREPIYASVVKKKKKERKRQPSPPSLDPLTLHSTKPHLVTLKLCTKKYSIIEIRKLP